jgi:hypothetical protein
MLLNCISILAQLFTSNAVHWLVQNVLADLTVLSNHGEMKRALRKLRKVALVGRDGADSEDSPPKVGWIFGKWFVAVVSQQFTMDGSLVHSMYVYRLRGTRSLDLTDKHVPLLANVLQIRVVRNMSVRHEPEWRVEKEIAYLPNETPALAHTAARAMLEHVRSRSKLGLCTASIVLFGPKGTGKSTAARLLAMELNAYFTADYKPTSPGHRLASVLEEANGKAMVVLVDEIDEMVSRFGEIEQHDDLVIEVRNREDWNGLCDKMRFKKNLIRVFTTNCTPAQLHGMDVHGSLFRQGRTSALFNVGGGSSYNGDNVVDVEAEARGIVQHKKEIAAAKQIQRWWRGRLYSRHDGIIYIKAMTSFLANVDKSE